MSAVLILRPDDARQLAMIHAESLPDPWSPAAIRGLLSEATVIGIGIEEQGDVVAFGLFRFVLDEAEILTIATAQQARRKGYAKRILKNFDHHSGIRGISRQFLEVADDNASAKKLYQKAGYTPDGRRKNYYNFGRSSPVDAILMSKSLVP